MNRKAQEPVVIAVLLGLMLAALLALLACPKILTGDFYEITFDSIVVHPDAKVDLHYRERFSHGTEMLEESTTNGRMNSSRGVSHNGFPGRPGTGEGGHSFWLASTAEKKRGGTDSPEIRKRLMLEVGKIYRLQDREKFVYFRSRDLDGSVREAYLEVNPRR